MTGYYSAGKTVRGVQKLGTEIPHDSKRDKECKQQALQKTGSVESGER